MSVARGFGLNGKSFYSNVAKPIEVWCNFTVTPTNGLGITSLKSNGYVESVFMHTSTTPTAVNGFTNPNPAVGYALVRFKNNFNYFLGGFQGQIIPTTSNSTTSLTTGSVYVITSVGTTTTAQWQTAGLLPGLVPAVGQAFVSLVTASLSGSGTVGLPAAPTATSLTIIGDPNASITNSNVASNAGAQVMVQFSAPIFTAGAYTPTGTISAPAFTGSALGNHTHSLLLKNAAVSDGATTRVNAGSNLLGANTGSDITVVGAGANGGVVNASAGTPAGSVSAPTFTGDAASLTGAMTTAAASPGTGVIVALRFCFDGSSVTIDGL